MMMMMSYTGTQEIQQSVVDADFCPYRSVLLTTLPTAKTRCCCLQCLPHNRPLSHETSRHDSCDFITGMIFGDVYRLFCVLSCTSVRLDTVYDVDDDTEINCI